MRAGARVWADSTDNETTREREQEREGGKLWLRGVTWQEEGQNNFLLFVMWNPTGIHMTETVDPGTMGVFPLFETDFFILFFLLPQLEVCTSEKFFLPNYFSICRRMEAALQLFSSCCLFNASILVRSHYLQDYSIPLPEDVYSYSSAEFWGNWGSLINSHSKLRLRSDAYAINRAVAKYGSLKWSWPRLLNFL